MISIPVIAADGAKSTVTLPDPNVRMFNGDYSTGNFAQWPGVQVKSYNSSGAGYQPTYSASIVTDPLKGKVARFEVRSGDVPAFGGGERAQVQGDPIPTAGTEGQVRWYQFSTKFDPTFPQNHHDLGWCITNSWHPSSDTGSGPIQWCCDWTNGYWTLVANKQSSPGVYLGGVRLWDTTLKVGQWHDIKMQVCWSTSDTVGWVRLWYNGVPQNFVNGAGTFTVRTLIPGTTTAYYKEGIYRQATTPTDIVYHTGFRCALTEAAL